MIIHRKVYRKRLFTLQLHTTELTAHARTYRICIFYCPVERTVSIKPLQLATTVGVFNNCTFEIQVSLLRFVPVWQYSQEIACQPKTFLWLCHNLSRQPYGKKIPTYSTTQVWGFCFHIIFTKSYLTTLSRSKLYRLNDIMAVIW
jgi:hypothetical protein